MSETCCMWLAENTGRKNDAKNRHLGTIPQLLSGYIFATKARIANRKKIIKQQYLLHTSVRAVAIFEATGSPNDTSPQHCCIYAA